MKKIVICIPTYNRPEIIEELLLRQGEIYKKLDFDVHICDSSDNDKTYMMYKRFCELYSFISYERFSPEIHSNLKVYRILQSKELQKGYDYIWIYSDVLRFSENALNEIKKSLDKNYDYIIPNGRDIDNVGTKEYLDCVQMFREVGWHMTLYGATIVNTLRVLKTVDWGYFEKKYCNPNTINFSHMCFFLEKMTTIESCKIFHLSINGHEYSSSPLRKRSAWYKDTFKLWCEYWIDAIQLLPEIYDEYKDEVIRKECIYSNIFTKENLIDLRIQGIFNWSVFVQYISRWNKVTDMNYFQLARIAIFARQQGETKLELAMRKKLYALQDEGKKIYIYGAGIMAAIMSEHLAKWGIEYEGYLVTDKSTEKDILNGHNVIEYSPRLWNGNIAIIIATNEKYEKEIWNHIDANLHERYVVKGYWL